MEKTIDLYHYKYFHSSRQFQKNPDRLKSMYEEVKPYAPKRMLDVGCGIGYFVKYCRDQGIEAYGIDFAPALKEHWWRQLSWYIIADAKNIPFSDNYFDLVFSSDFFEHIPEEEIEQVAKEMLRVSKNVVAKIAFENKSLHDHQLDYHCTNKPQSWWKRKLRGITVLDYD